MVNFNTIRSLFQFTTDSRNIIKDIPDHPDINKYLPEELLQFFPQHQNTLRRRFSENFYKCLDVHRRPRLVKKNGELNIHTENVHKRRRRLWSDCFNTILDIKWRWHFGIFLFSFVISWFLFANIWYLIALLHGDIRYNLEINGNGTNQLKNGSFAIETEKRTPCVHGVHDFTSALLYSVETQHTIGYGLRYITEECSFAIIFLMIQSCFGIFVQGMVAGVVFAKISRPNKRKRTIIFSHNACVSERDGKLCFMFKLANIRISQLSDARIKMHMIKSRRTAEGEFIPFQSYDMKVGHNWSGNDSIFFPWPKTVEHVIDEDSPLYEMCKQASSQPGSQEMRHYKRSHRFNSNTTTTTDSTLLSGNASSDSSKSIKSEDYEIVVILEGNIETTGASCHIRTSYLPQEILFGYRFTPIYPKFTDFEYLFDYAKFDHVEPIQYELLSLNVAFTNKHLNYVYDAVNESKNLYQTVQNTEQNMKNNTNQRRAENSIFSLLKVFGSNNVNVNENKTDLSNLFEDIKALPCDTNNVIEVVKEQDLMTSHDPPLNCSKPSKTGRFTVEAVKIDKPEETPITPDVSKIRFETKSVNERSHLKKNSLYLKKASSNLQRRNLSKQVLFHMHNNANSLSSLKLSYSNHHRANSLPPPKLKNTFITKCDLMKNIDDRYFDNSIVPRKKTSSLTSDSSDDSKKTSTLDV